MATITIPAPAGQTKPARVELQRVRAALIDRINLSAQKAMSGSDPESAGMPSCLFDAGCYLAAQGFDDEPCEGERWFNTDFASYRAFISFPDMAESGRIAIYDGCRAIAPAQAMEMAA